MEAKELAEQSGEAVEALEAVDRAGLSNGRLKRRKTKVLMCSKNSFLRLMMRRKRDEWFDCGISAQDYGMSTTNWLNF